MKKLLAVALVLGLASMANAAVINQSELGLGGVPAEMMSGQIAPITVNVISAVKDVGVFGLVVVEPAASLGNGVITAATGNYNIFAIADLRAALEAPDFWVPEIGTQDGFYFDGIVADGTVPSGPAFGFDLTAGDSDFVVNLYALNADLQVLGLYGSQSVIVPEPMSMSLLALGGLGLLRRRG